MANLVLRYVKINITGRFLHTRYFWNCLRPLIFYYKQDMWALHIIGAFIVGWFPYVWASSTEWAESSHELHVFTTLDFSMVCWRRQMNGGVYQSSSVHLVLVEATVCCTSPDPSCFWLVNLRTLIFFPTKPSTHLASVGSPCANRTSEQLGMLQIGDAPGVQIDVAMHKEELHDGRLWLMMGTNVTPEHLLMPHTPRPTWHGTM